MTTKSTLSSKTARSSKAGAVKMTAELKARLEQLDADYQKVASEFESLEDDPETVFIGLQLQALHEIQKAMDDAGINRAELARRLGCSRQNVQQIFSEDMNLKLEMVARVAAALGRDVAFRMIEKHEEVVVRESKAAAPVIEIVSPPQQVNKQTRANWFQKQMGAIQPLQGASSLEHHDLTPMAS